MVYQIRPYIRVLWQFTPFSRRRNIVIIMATFDTLLDTGAALEIEIVKKYVHYYYVRVLILELLSLHS